MVELLNRTFGEIYSYILTIKDGIHYKLLRSYIQPNLKINSGESLVSIIIATYNRGDILVNRTIPSLLTQTYNNIEIVIVGDCCIDDTEILVKKHYGCDSRVKFYNLSKRGRYPSSIKDRWFVQGCVPRNYGMKVAKGEWFVFISDDDILYPSHIGTLLLNAYAMNLEFISASYDEERDGVVNIIFPKAFDKDLCNLITGGMLTWMYKSELRFFKWNIHSWRKYYNRPVDYDLVRRMYLSGVKIGHINEVIARVPTVSGTNTVGYKAALELGE